MDGVGSNHIGHDDANNQICVRASKVQAYGPLQTMTWEIL